MAERGKNTLSFRVQVCALLIGFALLAWIMPDRQRSANELKPSEMIQRMSDPARFLSCDQVARIVVNEDSSFQLIDVRGQVDFFAASIPGAINIPFKEIMNPDWSGYLDDPEKKVVLYSDGDIMASEAWMLCTQKGYWDVRIMEGGMDRWYKLIMESEFTGERISAADNALFEIRYRARDFFTTMNSLPDSMKTVFLTVKRKQEEDLTGGCE